LAGKVVAEVVITRTVDFLENARSAEVSIILISVWKMMI
jgi:hypothetical protein